MRRLVFCCLVVSLALWVNPAFAQEVQVYRGEQTLIEDTVWSGEVLVDGILTVAAGVTLEIRPGTRVAFTWFDSNGDGIGEHEIFSQGTIRALGSKAEPVVFTSAESAPRPGVWGAVNMMVSEEENLLQHVVVEYGYRGFHAHFSRAQLKDSSFRENVRGAQFQESQVVIENCRFLDNINGLQFRDSKVQLKDTQISGSQWGLRCVYTDLEMSGCIVQDNLVNGVNIRDGKIKAYGNTIKSNRRGIYLQRSEGVVAGNDLVDNSEHGIFLEDSNAEAVDNRIVGNGRSGVRWLNSSGRLARNRIDANGLYGMINDGEGAVDARNNWWGSRVDKDIRATIRDGNDRPGLGFVDSSYALMKPMPFHLLEMQ